MIIIYVLFFVLKMCETMNETGNKPPFERFVTGILSSSGAGVAKASPGVAVSGAYFCGLDVQTWVSVLTCLYLAAMIFGAIPKAAEGLRYLYRLSRGRRGEKND